MRVLVIGGAGHLGASITKAFTGAGHEVAVGGRSATCDVQIDLSDPGSFAAMSEFDATINASDSIAAPPDTIVAHAIDAGLCFVETAAEPLYVRRQLATEVRGPGRALIGAGIFPGITNLMAAHLHAAGARELEIAIRWSPLSAAGKGMVRLASHLLDVPTHQWRRGELNEGPSVGAGPRFDFPLGSAPSLAVAFTEPDLVAHSLDLNAVSTYGSFEPNILMGAFRLTPMWLLRTGLGRALLHAQFTLLRRVIFRRRASRVQLATRDESGRQVSLSTLDGIALGGAATVAMAESLLAKTGLTGIATPDQVTRLQPALDRVNELGFEPKVHGV